MASISVLGTLASAPTEPCVCARDASLLYLKAVCEEGRTGLGVSWDHILFCPLLSVAAQDFLPLFLFSPVIVESWPP